MLAYRNLRDGRVFVEADQPPAVVTMASPGTIGVTLDESDLRSLLRAVQDPEPAKLTATRSHLAGGA
jgi:hypothetical protein